MKIGIVFPVLNQYELCVNAIESVKTQHDWQPFVIDQWRNRRPLSGAWNEGLKRARDARCDFTLISNDDVLYSPWTIDALVERLHTTDIIMATGVNDQGKYEHPGDILTIDKPTEISESENPDYSCFMVRSNFADHVGWFDENIYPAYFEDNESHIRLNVMGFKAVSTTAAPYYHYGSRTQNTRMEDPAANSLFDGNRAYLQAKWGTVDAHQLNFTHPFNDKANSPMEWKKEWRFANG